ncbi:lytic polysaccharide monooxygenase [Paenibacillus sp. JTLBN-2024]
MPTTSWKLLHYEAKTGIQTPRLTRDSFDLTPFCSVGYGGKQPPAPIRTTCTVPNRTGYQVILAVWEIPRTRPTPSTTSLT